jgi:hypothetical protein
MRGGGGGTRERKHEWGRVEGRGRGGGIAYVQVRLFLAYLLSENKLWAVTLEIFTHTAYSRRLQLLLHL